MSAGPRDEGADGVFGRDSSAAIDDVEHAAVQLLRHCLRQTRDTHALGDHAHAVIGLQLAGDELEQRRFALAVAAEQTDALAGLDRQIDAIDQRRITEAQVQITQCENCHRDRILTQSASRRVNRYPSRQNRSSTGYRQVPDSARHPAPLEVSLNVLKS